MQKRPVGGTQSGRYNRYRTRVIKVCHRTSTNHPSFRISILPSMICIGDVFFLHFGLWAGMMLYYGAMVSGWVNTILPLMKYQKEFKTSTSA